jgi:hypothetical protein
MLLGVIELPLTRVEVEQYLQEAPGIDHTEYTAIHFVALDPSDPRTSTYLTDQRKWSMGGLAAFVTAIHYWRSRKR